jgi:catechol 2,3-dioxygenase-like lactoylglutathione lyase family enzyme
MPFPLLRNHFQVAYVVRDMDAAIGRFTIEFGMPNWSVLEPRGGDGAMRRVAGSFVGDLMYELIEPALDRPSIFRDFLPAAPNDLRLHHLAFMIRTAEDYQATIGRLNEAGYPLARAGSWGEVLDFHIADTTATFGHYHELIYSKAKGEAYFKKLPRN